MPSTSTVLKSLYKPLDKDRHEIRLVRLCPSEDTECSISCELFVRSLDEDPKPNFSALSYEWGGAFGDKESISLNGIEVEIRPNLWSALKRLREADKEVIIWIDALCINQEDHEEKNHQVGWMCNIYKNATETYAWLGDERDGSDAAMAELSRLGEYSASLCVAYETAATDGKVHTTKLSATEMAEKMMKEYRAGNWNQAESLESRLMDSLKDVMKEYLLNRRSTVAPCQALLARSYWRRIWIIQEVTVSSRVEVICGGSRVDFSRLRGAIILMGIFFQRAWSFFPAKIDRWAPEDVEFMKKFRGDYLVAAGNLSGMRNRYQEGNKFNLIQLLARANAESTTARSETTESRDKVIALLGVANDTEVLKQHGLELDYAIPCRQVYTAAARAIILSGDVDLLAFSNFPKLDSMPSWTPDWRAVVNRPCGNYPWDTSFAVSGSRTVPRTICTRNKTVERLSLPGCVVDVIEQSWQPWRPGPEGCVGMPHATRQFLLDVYHLCALSKEKLIKSEGVGIYKNPTDGDNAFFRVPVADQAHGRNGLRLNNELGVLKEGYQAVLKDLDHKFGNEIRSWHHLLTRNELENNRWREQEEGGGLIGVGSTGLDSPFDPNQSYYTMMDCQLNRRPFLSAKGYVGLGPDRLLDGDVIVVFFGAKFPYILRKTTGGAYELVGEAYVHGIMYGEYIMSDVKPEEEWFELV